MKDILAQIEKYPVIPVFYHDDMEHCKNILKRAYHGGIRVFEFVNRGAAAKENFAALIAYKKEQFPDLVLGIGTIKSQKEASDFIRLGAEFIVSPIIKEEIAEVTLAKNILWIPGCMTPTEITLAEDLGAPLVKLFPGDTLGPNYLKAIKPLFPHTKFMPTGGVSLEANNLQDWFKSGVTAVGLGSKLFEAQKEQEDDQWLENRVKSVFQIIRSV